MILTLSTSDNYICRVRPVTSGLESFLSWSTCLVATSISFFVYATVSVKLRMSSFIRSSPHGPKSPSLLRRWNSPSSHSLSASARVRCASSVLRIWSSASAGDNGKLPSRRSTISAVSERPASSDAIRSFSRSRSGIRRFTWVSILAMAALCIAPVLAGKVARVLYIRYSTGATQQGTT
jgi:hypothetical protein